MKVLPYSTLRRTQVIKEQGQSMSPQGVTGDVVKTKATIYLLNGRDHANIPVLAAACLPGRTGIAWRRYGT
jgi:hypothetical protein